MVSERPPLRVLVAIALVSACVLAFQVLFTRLLSAVLAYHFSFLAISLALLGTGAGALLVYVRPKSFETVPLERVLARGAIAYGILLVAVPFGLVRLDLNLDLRVTGGFVTSLAAACVLAALPAFAAGVVVALAIRGYPSRVGRVYAFDLVGAGCGALVVVPLLRWPAPSLIVALGSVAAVAAVLLAGSAPTERVVGVAVAGLAVAALVAGGLTEALDLPSRYRVPVASVRVADDWTPLSRVQGYAFPTPGTGAVFYDRVYAPIVGLDHGVVPDWRVLSTGPQSIGYAIAGPGRALVIGGGGGRDIYTALSSGQRRVDVIEVNGAIRHVVDRSLRSQSGHPYSRARVRTSIGDGRSVLARRRTKYDQIQIGFTDTLSANSAQGFALTEANLYTIEAFEEYFDHLTPRGVLNVSRLDKLVGDESLRATVLTLAGLEHRGIRHPERNVVVIRGQELFGATYGTVLARLKPFSDAELVWIRALARERGLGVASAPGGPYQDTWRQLAAAPTWRSFCRSYRFNVCPPTDDKPFFFNAKRLSQIGSTQPKGYAYSVDPTDLLVLTLGVLLVLSVIGFLLPLPFRRGGARPRLGALAYFVAIGLGYLVLEVVLVQRFVLFLGFPTYALSVVLFALLIFTGSGSYLSARLGSTRRVLTTVLVSAVALIAATAFGLQPLLRDLIDLPFTARVAVSVALLAPFGVTLGMPMPIGLQRLRALHPDGVPWAWGVNGIASVLASVLAVSVAIFYGYAVASLVAAGCYAFALGHVLVGRWPTAAATG